MISALPPTSDIARQPRWTIESTFTLWQALYNPKVLLLVLNYVGIVTASLGMLIFVPQMMVPIRRLHGPRPRKAGGLSERIRRVGQRRPSWSSGP